MRVHRLADEVACRLRRCARGTALVVGALALFGVLVAPAFAELEDKEWKEAKKKFEQAAAQKDLPGMVEAIGTMAKDGTKRAVDALISIAENLEDAKVYDAARDALQAMQEPEAVAYMVKSLDQKTSQKDWTLRAVLVEGLIPHQGAEITTAMANRLDDNVPYVVSAAAKALGKRKDPKSVQKLVDVLLKLEKNKDVTWIDVKQALTDITGEDFPDGTSWKNYWATVGENFDPTKDRGDKKDSSTVVRADEASQFFKEAIVAKRIMFIIDISGSMEAEDPPIEGQGGGKRIERVKNELVKTIQGLKGDVSFNVLAFSHVLKSWKPIVPGASLHKAAPAIRADAVKWVSQLKEEGMTHTDDALKKGFEPLEVNTIVLLSDGAPARMGAGGQGGTPIDPEEILEKVRGMNRLRGVKIHTFCFEIFKNTGGAEPLLKFMEDLASQNGGKTTLIR